MLSTNFVSPFIQNPLSLILALIFLTSTHILIVNEEILVALSFGAFWIFSNRMLSDTISESFTQRKKDILSSLSSCFQLEQVQYSKNIEDALDQSLVFQISGTNQSFVHLSSPSEGIQSTLDFQKQSLHNVYNSSISAAVHKNQELKSTEMNVLHNEFRSLLVENISKEFSSRLLKDAKKNLDNLSSSQLSLVKKNNKKKNTPSSVTLANKKLSTVPVSSTSISLDSNIVIKSVSTKTKKEEKEKSSSTPKKPSSTKKNNTK